MADDPGDQFSIFTWGREGCCWQDAQIEVSYRNTWKYFFRIDIKAD